MTNLRIGISMRETNAENYHEIRDSIARDWYPYLKWAFEDANWMLIPSLGEESLHYFQSWELNALILSGGENIGTSPERDTSEKVLYRHCRQTGLPVVGICRGMQLINEIHGGSIEQGDSQFCASHVAKRHDIVMNSRTYNVNSYHGNRMNAGNLGNELEPLATCIQDNSIEAFKGKNTLGLMWHPERETHFQEWDKKLITEVLIGTQ